MAVFVNQHWSLLIISFAVSVWVYSEVNCETLSTKGWFSLGYTHKHKHNNKRRLSKLKSENTDLRHKHKHKRNKHVRSSCSFLCFCLCLVEHCTSIAEVMGLNPVQAWIFQGCFFCYLFCFVFFFFFFFLQQSDCVDNYVNLLYILTLCYEHFLSLAVDFLFSFEESRPPLYVAPKSLLPCVSQYNCQEKWISENKFSYPVPILFL